MNRDDMMQFIFAGMNDSYDIHYGKNALYIIVDGNTDHPTIVEIKLTMKKSFDMAAEVEKFADTIDARAVREAERQAKKDAKPKKKTRAEMIAEHQARIREGDRVRARREAAERMAFAQGTSMGTAKRDTNSSFFQLMNHSSGRGGDNNENSTD